MILAVAVGLGLTLALNYVLSTGWEATAASIPLSAEHPRTEAQSQALPQLSQTGSFYPIFQTKKLTAADGEEGDYFGWAVAADGDTIVVGAKDDDGRGSVYLFTRNEGGADNWGLMAHVTATDGATGDKFGCAVAIDRDTLVVGAQGDDSKRGSAYVFTRNEGGADNWGQTAKITAADVLTDDMFGIAVAIDGDTVVVGASGGYGEPINYGSAYVFTRDEGGADNWGLTARLTATDVMTEDLFGRSVAVSGDTVVVGSPYDSDTYDKSGSVYLFTRDEGGADNWGQTAKITATGSIDKDYFGWAVTLSGDILVVGVENDDDNGQDSGSVYLFGRDEGGADNWGLTAHITATDGDSFDSFGRALALDGDTLVVGAYHDDENGYYSGSAYIFARDEGGADNWGQVTKITPTDGGEGYWFGGAVAISGETIVVGAHGDDSYTGSAYVFDVFAVYLPLVMRNCP